MKLGSFGKVALCTFTLTTLFSISAFAANQGIVVGTDVNIRSDSNTASAVIRKGNTNELFTVTASANSFYKINGNGLNNGFIKFDFFKIISADAQVAGDNVNIRKEPSTNASVLTKLNLGTPITIVGQTGDWYAFKYGNSIAYINKSFALGTFIKSVPDVSQMVLTPPAVQTTVETTTQATTAKVQTAVETTTQATTAKAQTAVETTTQAATAKAQTAAETTTQAATAKAQTNTETMTQAETGNLAEETLNEDAPTMESNEEVQEAVIEEADGNVSLGEAMVAYAKQFLGTPYVYGGTNLSSGVDCSGFTSSVYKHFGYSINRVSSDQIANGTPVSKDNLIPGDLIFFNTGGNTRISHVAIYIGNGQYIHSTDAKGRGVSIASLSDSYSTRTYCGACRVIK